MIKKIRLRALVIDHLFLIIYISVSSDTSPKTAIVVSIGWVKFLFEGGWTPFVGDNSVKKKQSHFLETSPKTSLSPSNSFNLSSQHNSCWEKTYKRKKCRAFEVRKPGFFWSISSSNMCDTRPRNSLFTIKNIPVFHHRNDKMTKNTQDCVLLKNIVEMHHILLMMISMTLKVLEDFVIKWELGCCFSI